MMLKQRHQKMFAALAIAFVAVMLFCMPAAAQCPLCRISVESSSQGAAMGRGLNLGILVLLIPPVTIFCSIFFLALKHRKFREG